MKSPIPVQYLKKDPRKPYFTSFLGFWFYSHSKVWNKHRLPQFQKPLEIADFFINFFLYYLYSLYFLCFTIGVLSRVLSKYKKRENILHSLNIWIIPSQIGVFTTNLTRLGVHTNKCGDTFSAFI